VSLQVVDSVIELLDGLVVAVHHGVEQAVGEGADLVAAVDQPGVEVPVRDQGVDVEVVLADRDERPGGDEDADLAGGWRVAALVDGDGVHAGEQVGAVAVNLGPLVRADGILDGEGMEAELLGDDLEVSLGGLVEVQPRDRALVGSEALAELLRREALVEQLAAPVETRAGGTLRRDRPPGR
jgi:hypothetical protein